MSDLKQNEDYKLILNESEDKEKILLQILKGNFKGVIFNISNVKVVEILENENANLSFDFDIIDNNGIQNLEENENFKNHIGNILLSIIINSIEEEKEFENLIEDVDYNEE